MVIPGNNNQNNLYGMGMQQNLPCCGPQHNALPCCESIPPQYPMPQYPYYRRRVRRSPFRRRRNVSPNLYNLLNKIHKPRRIDIPPLPPPPPRPPRQFYKPIIQQTDPQLMKDLDKCLCKLDKCKDKRCTCENQLYKCMCNMSNYQNKLSETNYKLKQCMCENEECQCQLQQCMCGEC